MRNPMLFTEEELFVILRCLTARLVEIVDRPYIEIEFKAADWQVEPIMELHTKILHSLLGKDD